MTFSAPPPSAADRAELAPRAGLCSACGHLRVLRSRGSAFVRCGRSDGEPDYPRYPRLPVAACRGFEALGEVGQSDQSDQSDRSDQSDQSDQSGKPATVDTLCRPS